MKRILGLSLLTLAMLAGVASADRGRHRGHYKHRDGASWSGGVHVSGPRVVVRPRVVVQQPRRVYVQQHRVVRRPIYVQAPRVRVRYHNYYQQPQVLAENYAPMTGYYWVAGQWTWTGYEWTWTAGHYEPDPNYVEPSYDYNAGYSVSAGFDYGSHNHDPNCGHDQY